MINKTQLQYYLQETPTPTPLPSDKLITTISLNVYNEIFGVAVNENTNIIYAAILIPNCLAVIDGNSNTLITSIYGDISIGDGPRGVAVNPTTNKVYVAQGNFPTTHIIVVDGNTNTIIKSINTSGYIATSRDRSAGIYVIAVNPTINKIYICNLYSSMVSVIDGNSDTLLSNISLPGGAYDTAINSSTNNVYVTNFNSGIVSVIDGNTDIVTATINVGRHPRGIAVDPDNNKIYVGRLSFLTVIDGNTNTVIKDIPITGNGDLTDGEGVGFNKFNGKIYVSPGIDIIDERYGVIQTIPGGWRQLAINNNTGRVYVANPHDIMVIQGTPIVVPPTTPPPTPPPTTTTGNADISSIPLGAEIFIDGVDQSSVTPITMTGLSVGTHTYLLVLNNYANTIGYFDIIADQTTTVNTIMPVAIPTGFLYISSTPPGAEIFIDDDDQFLTTPNLIPNLSQGYHSYKLTLTGYTDVTGIASIMPGQIFVETAYMAQISESCIRFHSNPTKAEISIDGIDTDVKTPAYICRKISIGSHAFSMDGTVDIPASGSYEFKSDPSSTEIWIDGIDTGYTTPYRFDNLTVGSHVFSLKGIITI